jgi:hypothetical protein
MQEIESEEKKEKIIENLSLTQQKLLSTFDR